MVYEKRYLRKLSEDAVKGLQEMSTADRGFQSGYSQVASISAADEEIGSLIARGYGKGFGNDGVITVEESKTTADRALRL